MERGGYTAATTYASSYNIRFSSCPKRNCNGRPFRLANFDFPSRHPWEQAVSFWGAFPASQSAIAMGDPSNWQISKNNFSEPEKLFFWFSPPSRHPWEQAVSFSGAFPASQSAIAMGDPSNWQISKNNFSEPEKLFFWFSPPSRHPWEQAVSFSGAFPAAQSAIAMGEPSNWQISKNNFSEPQKLFFWFSPPETVESRQWAFQVLFQLPKAQLQWETLLTGKFQKTIFQSLKSCFFDFHLHPDTLESRQWAFQVLFQLPKAQLQWENLPTGKFQKTTFQSLKSCFFDFPLQKPLRAGSELFRCFSSCPKRNCNGRPFQLANFKKQLFRVWEVVFLIFPSRKFSGVGKEPAWSHKNRENSESWWNEAR